MTKFNDKFYNMTVIESNDAITVTKLSKSDWSSITMTTNGNVNRSITIRSKAMAKQLHIMLGQMLGE